MSPRSTAPCPRLPHLPCVVAALLCACGGMNLPVTPAQPDDGFSDPEPVARPGLPGDAPTALQLQPGDAVTVEVISTTTQSHPDLLLDGTGIIHLPLAGDVKVGGLGLTGAEQAITQQLQQFDKLVQVSIRITGFGGQRATVLGSVKKQGSVQLIPGARLADVVALAGGATLSGNAQVALADLSGAVLKRDDQALPVDFRKALRGEALHNVHVQPGDMIYVPPTLGGNISVLGQVGGGGKVFPHREGMRLTEALALAGGVTAGGDKNDVRIIRGTLTEPSIYRTSLAHLVAGETHDVVMRPGDIIYVSDHWIEDVTEVVALVSPLLSTAMTVTTATVLIRQ